MMLNRKLQAALITTDQNVYYLSGFTGTDSALLITAHHKILLTDFRFIEEAKHSAVGWRVVHEKSRARPGGKIEMVIPHGLMEKAGLIARKLGLRKVAIEPGNIRVIELAQLRHSARTVKFKPEEGMVAELRLCKSMWEICQIEQALRIQESAFNELFGTMAEGASEREAAARLRYLMVLRGAEDHAFNCMFQIGSNASLPHGRPTDRALSGNELILLDWGARYAGYHSDLTRTFFTGTIPTNLRKIHNVVMEAQQAAIAAISPGVALAEVDNVARTVIDKSGYGKAFGHSTGHGLGLEIHEAPALSARSRGKLFSGMVVTVEPGVYLPGIGGVRIEDDVLVTSTGHRVLSRLKTGLRWNGEND